MKTILDETFVVADHLKKPLPEGDYTATIDEVKIKPTKSGDGKYLEIRYRVDNGRLVWGKFMIAHTDLNWVEKERQRLNSVCTMIGIERIDGTDFSPMLNRRVVIHVAINRWNYNDVIGYTPLKNEVTK